VRAIIEENRSGFKAAMRDDRWPYQLFPTKVLCHKTCFGDVLRVRITN
jgi:hypothetical protein